MRISFGHLVIIFLSFTSSAWAQSTSCKGAQVACTKVIDAAYDGNPPYEVDQISVCLIRDLDTSRLGFTFLGQIKYRDVNSPSYLETLDVGFYAYQGSTRAEIQENERMILIQSDAPPALTSYKSKRELIYDKQTRQLVFRSLVKPGFFSAWTPIISSRWACESR